MIWHVLVEGATNKSRYNTSSNQTNGRHIYHIKESQTITTALTLKKNLGDTGGKMQ